MQTRLSIISNIIFKYFLIFSISFLWLNFYIDNLLIVGTISLIISLAIGQLLGYIFRKKQNRKKLSLKEHEKMQDISLQFFLADHESILKFFQLLLSTKHDLQNGKDTKSLFFDNCVFIPYYSTLLITPDIIAQIFKNYKNKDKIYISAITFSDESRELAKKINGEIVENSKYLKRGKQ